MKCKKTTSGKHIWQEGPAVKQHEAVDQGIRTYWIKTEKCKACGIIKWPVNEKK